MLGYTLNDKHLDALRDVVNATKVTSPGGGRVLGAVGQPEPAGRL